MSIQGKGEPIFCGNVCFKVDKMRNIAPKGWQIRFGRQKGG